MNIVIPAAGRGIRFEQAGYLWPKPLIPLYALNGRTMIQAVTESVGIKAHYIYIIQERHDQEYNFSAVLKTIDPGCSIIKINEVTEGAAVTVLKARDLIDNNEDLMVVNSDQIVEWDSHKFFEQMNHDQADGGILTFDSNHPRWSFAEIDSDGYVQRVAEKKPLPGNHATCGLYWFRKGGEFVKYADQMITKNIRVNSEFYLCPVYNQFVEDGKQIKTFDVKKMWGIGDPQGLQYFEEHYNP